MMVVSPDIQNSFGPEVTASEHLPQAVPQTSEAESPLYFVADHNRESGSPPPPEKPAEEKAPKKRIFGLTVPVFWALTAGIVLLVLGAGVGVGVGVGVAGNNKSSSDAAPDTADADNQDPADTSPSKSTSPSASASPSSTSSAPVTSGTVGLADNSCTSSTPRTYTASDGSHFTQFCFTDWPNGEVAADGTGKVKDLLALTLYTFEDCMDACLEYNEDLDDQDTSCSAVSYNSNLTSIVAVGKQGGNCFLKNKRGKDHTGSAESACAAIAQ